MVTANGKGHDLLSDTWDKLPPSVRTGDVGPAGGPENGDPLRKQNSPLDIRLHWPLAADQLICGATGALWDRGAGFRYHRPPLSACSMGVRLLGLWGGASSGPEKTGAHGAPAGALTSPISLVAHGGGPEVTDSWAPNMRPPLLPTRSGHGLTLVPNVCMKTMKKSS
ncbi:unnamed protein product [Arctogadus glacialis]